MTKKTNYIPKRKHNPVVFAKKIEKMQIRIEKDSKQRKMLINALMKHVEYLTNFTSHDIKNAIQNMDSIVSTIDLENFQTEDINGLKTCLKNIRTSLENFSKLVPNSNKKEFNINELIKATELINRNAFSTEKILFKVEGNKKDQTIIKQPFHNLLQVMNNLIINSVKALKDNTDEKKIKIIYEIDISKVIIYICDNGSGIEELNKEKIFEMYFSTSDGTGVGLYHAKYTLDGIKGNITLLNEYKGYKTVFKLEIPINDEEINSCNR